MWINKVPPSRCNHPIATLPFDCSNNFVAINDFDVFVGVGCTTFDDLIREPHSFVNQRRAKSSLLDSLF